jgi:hypothetical protein
MNKYPDNVITFPVSKRSAAKPSSRHGKSLPAANSDAVSFIKEILDVIDSVDNASGNAEDQNTTIHSVPVQPAYTNQFVTMAPLRALDFDLFVNNSPVEDSELLDRYLVALSSQIGPEATRKLTEVIEGFVAEVADIAFAEGLTEGAIPLK